MNNKKAEDFYTKEQILQSKKFKKDIVSALLKDNRTYTISQVEELINTFLKREVS